MLEVAYLGYPDSRDPIQERRALLKLVRLCTEISNCTVTLSRLSLRNMIGSLERLQRSIRRLQRPQKEEPKQVSQCPMVLRYMQRVRKGIKELNCQDVNIVETSKHISVINCAIIDDIVPLIVPFFALARGISRYCKHMPDKCSVLMSRDSVRPYLPESIQYERCVSLTSSVILWQT